MFICMTVNSLISECFYELYKYTVMTCSDQLVIQGTPDKKWTKLVPFGFEL